MSNIHIKKDDTVIVISGEDKNKKGKVLAVDAEKGKVVVEGVNIASKHTKPRKQGETGGIMKKEIALSAGKVMLFCKKCGKGVRVGTKVLSDGTKVRVCKKCNETFNN